MKKNNPILFILLFVIIFIALNSCTTTKNAITNFDEAPLFGMVYDVDNRPVEGVNLMFVYKAQNPFQTETTEKKDKKVGTEKKGSTSMLSDINGRFIIPKLTKGSHILKFTKENYEDLTINVNFIDKTQILYIKMTSYDQLLHRAEDAIYRKEYENAEAFLKRAELIKKNDPLILFFRAIIYYKESDYKSAEVNLLKLLDSDLEKPYINLFLSDIYQYNLNEPDKALENLKIFLKSKDDPDIVKRIESLSIVNK